MDWNLGLTLGVGVIVIPVLSMAKGLSGG